MSRSVFARLCCGTNNPQIFVAHPHPGLSLTHITCQLKSCSSSPPSRSGLQEERENQSAKGTSQPDLIPFKGFCQEPTPSWFVCAHSAASYGMSSSSSTQFCSVWQPAALRGRQLPPAFPPRTILYPSVCTGIPSVNSFPQHHRRQFSGKSH